MTDLKPVALRVCRFDPDHRYNASVMKLVAHVCLRSICRKACQFESDQRYKQNGSVGKLVKSAPSKGVIVGAGSNPVGATCKNY